MGLKSVRFAASNYGYVYGTRLAANVWPPDTLAAYNMNPNLSACKQATDSNDDGEYDMVSSVIFLDFNISGITGPIQNVYLHFKAASSLNGEARMINVEKYDFGATIDTTDYALDVGSNLGQFSFPSINAPTQWSLTPGLVPTSGNFRLRIGVTGGNPYNGINGYINQLTINQASYPTMLTVVYNDPTSTTSIIDSVSGSLGMDCIVRRPTDNALIGVVSLASQGGFKFYKSYDDGASWFHILTYAASSYGAPVLLAHPTNGQIAILWQGYADYDNRCAYLNTTDTMSTVLIWSTNSSNVPPSTIRAMVDGANIRAWGNIYIGGEDLSRYTNEYFWPFGATSGVTIQNANLLTEISPSMQTYYKDPVTGYYYLGYVDSWGYAVVAYKTDYGSNWMHKQLDGTHVFTSAPAIFRHNGKVYIAFTRENQNSCSSWSTINNGSTWVTNSDFILQDRESKYLSKVQSTYFDDTKTIVYTQNSAGTIYPIIVKNGVADRTFPALFPTAMATFGAPQTAEGWATAPIIASSSPVGTIYIAYIPAVTGGANFFVKVGGVMKNPQVYLRKSGAWVDVTASLYVRQGGVWKQL